MIDSKELTPEEKARKARAAYMRQWRATHKEQAKANTVRTWARKYDKMKAEGEIQSEE